MNNLKYFLVVLVALLPSVLCRGKKVESLDTISARRAFMEMPASVLDILSKNSRFDMLAYYDNDSIYKAENNLRGISYLEKVTDDFLSVKLTDASSLQIKILKLKDGNDLIMSIYTTGREKEALDSDIRFYNTAMQELPKEKFFPTPELSLFFSTKGYKTSMKEIEQILPFYTILFQANPDNSNVSGKLTLGDILTVEDTKLVEMFLKPEVIFEWNGKMYKAITKTKNKN